MDLRYLFPRVIRHFMPSSLARWLLKNKLIISPGLETSDPDSAVERYRAALEEMEVTFQNKRVMVFGYGGNFAVGCALLQSGAQHVILCDRFAPPDHKGNQVLLGQYSAYISQADGQVLANPAYITLLEADIRQVAAEGSIQPVDIVISSSVYEHLDDVEGITAALAQITCPDGFGLHFIDLRDHFFRFPFEMLRFSQKTWKGWLNPTSNLNRYRIWNYRKAFEDCYQKVDITILEQDEAEFEKIRPAIYSEFLNGNQDEETATILRVAVFSPKHPRK